MGDNKDIAETIQQSKNQKVKRKKNYGVLYTLPLTIWLTLFFVIPTSIIFLDSFMKKGLYGGVELQFSLEAYKALSNPSFLEVLWDTVYISVAATIITVVLAIPTSYYIARSKYKSLFLFLIIIPFWTSFLIRIFAWMAILGNNGFINIYFTPYIAKAYNVFYTSIGSIEPLKWIFYDILKWSPMGDSIQLLYTPTSIIIVTVYTYLPYAILPLYATIEKFDFALLEAARDLGATKRQAVFKVLIPNIKVGITTAVLFTFIPSLGSYAIPKLVGGTQGSTMIGNIIDDQLLVARNWPLAASISVCLTIVTTIGVLIFVKLNSNKSEQIRNERIKK